MQLTPFGWLYLPLVAWILIRRRDLLPALLLVAAGLHAPAAVVLSASPEVKGLGINPWSIACLAVFLHLCALGPRQVWRSITSCERDLRTLLAGWMTFALLCIVSAFTLPFLFAGTPTFNPMETLSIAAGTAPLEWRASNAVHALNLAIIAMLFLYGVVARPLRQGTGQLVAGLLVAAILSASLSIAQRLLRIAGGWEHWLVAESLNPSYHHTVGNIFWQDELRMGWPFSEPSYASAWFATLLVVGLLLYFWSGPHRRAGLAILVASTLGLLGSFSATGIAAAMVGSLVVWSVGAVLAWKRRNDDASQALKRHGYIALFGLVVVSVAYTVAVNDDRHYPRFNVYSTWDAAKLYVQSRIKDHERPGNTRAESNRVAAELITTTQGLGVGLGANRASSYVLNLLSNVGIIPALLLGSLLLLQWQRLWRSKTHELTHALVLVAAGGTMLTAVAIGIPDLLWPAWWIWPVLAFWRLSSALKPEPTHTVCT